MSFIFLLFYFLSSSCYHDDELTSRLVLREVSYHLRQRAPDALLMYLGNLAAYTNLTLWTKHLTELLQRLQHSVGRLIEHHGTLLVDQALDLGLTTFLLRQGNPQNKNGHKAVHSTPGLAQKP